MTFFFNILKDSYPGYAGVFACCGLGFLFLGRVDGKDVGPGYWALAFFMNSLGFLFWSGFFPLPVRLYLLLGEIFHMCGFFLLAWGVYRFSGFSYRPWNLVVAALWAFLWAVSILNLPRFPLQAGFALKALRSVIYIASGVLILAKPAIRVRAAGRIAGGSLMAWGAYLLFFAFIRLESNHNLYFGFLTGFQILAAFGLVAMLVDRMKLRAEESEERVRRLEGILPICAYCKKIRRADNEWQVLEAYIEDHSKAEFSHGICPECMEKHRPDRD